jgi:hypothetical protein
LAVIGFLVFTVGYVRKSRNLMLLGTIALIIGLGWKDLLAGMKAGWTAG